MEFQIHIKTANSTHSNMSNIFFKSYDELMSNSTEMSNPIELVPLSTELLNQCNEISSTEIEKGTIWFNGMKYVGEYKRGGINGYGVLYKNGKKVYEGEWKNNQCNGKGIEYHAYGWVLYLKVYEGEWKNNQRNGKGIEYHQNGEKVYEGEWKNNQRNGKGIEYHHGEKVYEGEWINGEKLNQ